MGTAFGGAGVEPGTTIDEAIKDQQNGLKIKLQKSTHKKS